MPEYRVSILVVGEDKASAPLNRVGGALGSIGTIAGGILAAGFFQKVAGGILDVAKNAISATADIQAMQIGLESLLARELTNTEGGEYFGNMRAALEGAKQPAADLMDELANIAMVSPYQLETVNNTFRMQMAFGATTDQAKLLTKGMLDMAAGIGAGGEQLDRMAYNFAQIRMQGKVTAMDIRQLAMAGFDLNSVLKYTGKQMGVNIQTHEDFNKAIASGKITWEDFTESFAKYSEENFGGASDRMARTLKGLASTFKDVFALTMPQVLGPAAQVVTDFLGGILDNFLKIRETGVLEDFGVRLGASVERGITALRGFGEQARAAFASGKIAGMVDGVQKGMARAFKNIGAFWAQNGPKITEAISGVGRAIIQFFGGAAERIIPWLVEKFGMLAKWMQVNGPMIADVIAKIGEYLQFLINAALAAWPVIQAILDGVIRLILNLATTVLNILTLNWAGAWESLKTTIGGILVGVETILINFVAWLLTVFLGGDFQTWLTTVKTKWGEFKTAAEEKFAEVKTAIITKFTEIKTEAATKFEEIKTTITTIVDNIRGMMEEKFTAAKSVIDTVTSAVGGVLAKLGELWDWVQANVISIKINFPSPPGWLMDFLDDGQFNGSNTADTDENDKKKAYGGGVHAGQIVRMNEGGRQEAFMPYVPGQIVAARRLEKILAGSSGGGGHTENKYFGPVTQVIDAASLTLEDRWRLLGFEGV